MAVTPIKHHTKVGGVGVNIVGSVNVAYPNVAVAVDVHVKLPFVGKHSYHLKCGPGHLHDEHTEKYTAANFPITVTRRLGSRTVFRELGLAAFLRRILFGSDGLYCS